MLSILLCTKFKLVWYHYGPPSKDQTHYSILSQLGLIMAQAFCQSTLKSKVTCHLFTSGIYFLNVFMIEYYIYKINISYY